MDAFVRRLVVRLCEADAALSRNRHFHTFESAEGRLALRTARRLTALRRDLLAAHACGQSATFTRQPGPKGRWRLELRLPALRVTRVTLLDDAELGLLRDLPGVKGMVELPAPRPASR